MSETKEALDEITYCSLSFLLKQSAQARLLKRGSKNIHAHQSGQHLSLYKGRGMDFTESRLYQSGDDVRLLDWRVTARTGKPHTKVFSEEREQPVMLIIDMRPAMFFGTQGCYKSVMAAKVASLLAWKSLQDGDKVGGIIIPSCEQAKIHKPSRSQSAVSRFINTIAHASEPCSTTQKRPLVKTLKQLHPLIETGTQIIMLSDFRGLDNKAVQQLTALASKSSLHLIHISDPFEIKIASDNNPDSLNNGEDKEKPPSLANLQVSNGSQTLSLNKEALSNYRQVWQNRIDTLTDLSHHDNIHLLNLSTTDTPSSLLLTLSRGIQ